MVIKNSNKVAETFFYTEVEGIWTKEIIKFYSTYSFIFTLTSIPA